MNNKFFIKILSIIVVFSTLGLPFSRLVVLAQGEDPVTYLSPPLEKDQLPTGFHETELWVVRVYFSSRQQANDLAAWIEPWEINHEESYLVVGISPDQYSLLLAQGYRVEIEPELTNQANQTSKNLPGQVSGIPGYPCYRTVEETHAAAAEITTNYPTLAEWIDIGNSWEKTSPGGLPGYDLMLLKLTNSNITGEKPKLFIMSAMHAREYATAELNTRFAEYLVANYDIDADITWLLDNTEIHLLLQANPDGRKHAESGDFWRKNTNENYCGPTSYNRGADLNRNYEFQWGLWNGSSGNECEETYRGPSPASEPEVQAVQNYLRSIFPDQRVDDLNSPAPENATGVFIDIHAHGKLVIWPWGFTSTNAPNAIALQTLGRKFAYFNDYAPSQAYEFYRTDGTTDDFAYGDLGLAAYTFELGNLFFQDCSTFESAILPKNLPALIYAAKVSRTPYLTPAGPDVVDIDVVTKTVLAGDVIKLSANITDTRYSKNNGIEESQNINAAEYYIDLPPWDAAAFANPMNPKDGLFDTSHEEVIATIDTIGITGGRHTIFMRGQDADGSWGAVSAFFVTLGDIFDITKTASTYGVLPGEIFTYTLESRLALTGTNSYTLSLIDHLPAEVAVLTDSIRANGIIANGLYIPETHTIHYYDSGIFTETHESKITFQAQVTESIISGTEIINRLDGQVKLNSEIPLLLKSVQTSIKAPSIFLPLIANKSW